MDIKTKEAYSEISEILWVLGDSYLEKLPEELIKYIESNKSKEYMPIYSCEDAIDELDLREETKAILAFLYLSYWCNSEEEKKEIVEQIKNNDKEYELKESVNNLKLNELFPNKNKVINENYENVKNQLMPIKKESLFRRIINKIKKILS